MKIIHAALASLAVTTALIPAITFKASANPAINTKILPLNPNLIRGINSYSSKNKPKSSTPGKKASSSKYLPNSIKKSTIFIPPSMMRETRKNGFNKNSVSMLQGLTQKARLGTASDSEMDELLRLCNIASDYSSKDARGNKFDRATNNTREWNNDRTSAFDQEWNKSSSKKGGGKFGVSLSPKNFGVSFGGKKGKSSTNQGSINIKNTNTSVGKFDRSATSSGESMSENMQNRIAQTECDAVVALLGTKDTNKTNLEIERMKLENAKELKKMEIEARKAELRRQGEGAWVEMGASLIEGLMSQPRNQSGQSAASQNQELMRVIDRQQQQIDALMSQQKQQTSSNAANDNQELMQTIRRQQQQIDALMQKSE